MFLSKKKLREDAHDVLRKDSLQLHTGVQRDDI